MVYVKSKKPTSCPELSTWNNLNKHIMNCSEKECQDLLKKELRGRKRKEFIYRIYARLSKLRCLREKKELGIER